ncbi:hypothetical protein [Aestuariirhabdus sp. LZHN29]|uniref:hypothetical protein n=1 Tax=Aestuariirhabdus sp. LZHN29 TaxID=3417462 RepID=UPI003CF9C333
MHRLTGSGQRRLTDTVLALVVAIVLAATLSAEAKASEPAPDYEQASSLERVALAFGFRWTRWDKQLWLAQVKGFTRPDGTVDEFVRASLLLSVGCLADNKALAEGSDAWYLSLMGQPSALGDPATFMLATVNDDQLPPGGAARRAEWGMRHVSGEMQEGCGARPSAQDGLVQTGVPGRERRALPRPATSTGTTAIRAVPR